MQADATSMASSAPDPRARGAQLRDWLELTKPRITMTVLLTTAVGFLLAEAAGWWPLLVHALVGTALVASGASVLNQVVERHSDARMRRTARRPLPAGRLRRESALEFGVALAVAGMLYLAVLVNLPTAVLGALTLALYVFVYTPMKRRSALSTLVGAVPGAVPPMMGVTAATGRVDLLAWALFGLLFVWQMPHFLAIAWLYRSDYERGGFPMLTVIDDERGERTARQTLLYAACLVPVSLLPSALGIASWPYLAGALVLGFGFLAFAFAFTLKISLPAARRLVLASILYLIGILTLLLVDQAVTT